MARIYSIAVVVALAITSPSVALGQHTDGGADPFASDFATARSGRADDANNLDDEQGVPTLLPQKGDWGIGAVQIPSGLRGIEVEYYLDTLMVSSVVAFQRYSPEGGDAVTVMGIAGGAFRGYRSADDVVLYLGGRLVIGYGSVSDVTAVQFNVELPARLQWYFADNLALHFESGLVLAIIPKEGEVIGTPPGFGHGKGVAFGIGNTSLFGSAGLTMYF